MFDNAASGAGREVGLGPTPPKLTNTTQNRHSAVSTPYSLRLRRCSALVEHLRRKRAVADLGPIGSFRRLRKSRSRGQCSASPRSARVARQAHTARTMQNAKTGPSDL